MALRSSRNENFAKPRLKPIFKFENIKKMILPFSTQLNGKETFFVDKIWSGLIDRKLSTIDMCRAYETARKIAGHKPFAIVPHYKSKLHTIREDKNNRWQVGTNIDFYINVRQKSMFRFAPKLAVKSIQRVSILWSCGKINTCTIWIDENCYVANYSVDYNSSQLRHQKMEQLSQNDGFDSVQDLLDYFSENFYGKIIHWTDLKY